MWKSNADADVNAKPNRNGDRDGYTHIHTKADAHPEDCTNAKGASDASTTTVAIVIQPAGDPSGRLTSINDV